MISRSIAKRYARGLFAAGEKDGRYRDYLSELDGILRFFKEEERLGRALMLPILEMEKRKELLAEVLRIAGVSPAVANMVTIILEKNRMNYLPIIREIYDELVDEKEGRVKGTLYSPYPLGPDIKKRIEDIMSHRLKRNVVFDYVEDRDLIAGIKITVKGTIIDGTVKRQLEIMKENIFKE